MKHFARIGLAAGLAAVALSMPLGLQAQTFPARSISLVVPNPPGGLVDTSARLVAEPLARVIGQPVVVENRPGASGNLAYLTVARSAKDGYTLLVSYSGYHIANPILMDKLSWELKDLTPVGLITVATNVIAVHFLRFELDAAMVAFVQAGAGVRLGCDHTHYPAHTDMAAPTLASLAGDFNRA